MASRALATEGAAVYRSNAGDHWKLAGEWGDIALPFADVDPLEDHLGTNGPVFLENLLHESRSDGHPWAQSPFDVQFLLDDFWLALIKYASHPAT